MTALLASVRDLAEARVAVAAGVDWLDLKEPLAGALGAVPVGVAREAADAFAGRLPLSATIGDCWDTPRAIPARVRALADAGVPFVKIGLFAREAPRTLLRAVERAAAAGPRLIAVCFAEAAPEPDDVALLAATGLAGVMLDTADKRGGGLRRHVAPDGLRAFVDAARSHGLLVGLAGSLRHADVAPLAALAPDYLGFRGALCAHGQRGGRIDAGAIRDLKDALAASRAVGPRPHVALARRAQ